LNNDIMPLIINPYIRFVSLTNSCNEEFYVGNLKKFSPNENIRSSGYRKCMRGDICIILKTKKTESILIDSSAHLAPGDIFTFISYESKGKINLTKIKEKNEIRDPGYAYLKICYPDSGGPKINLSSGSSCFCRDIKCGDTSRHIGFVPGEYCFSIHDNNGKLLALTESLTLENRKCYTLYVTTDENGIFKTLITTDVGNPECFWMLN